MSNHSTSASCTCITNRPVMQLKKPKEKTNKLKDSRKHGSLTRDIAKNPISLQSHTLTSQSSLLALLKALY